MERLERLTAGMTVLVGGDQVVHVDEALAASFRPGDRLLVAGATGALLHVPAAEHLVVHETVGRAVAAFAEMSSVSDEQVTAFFGAFADRLEDDLAFSAIAADNALDVAAAAAAGRSTTRLVLSEKMRADMVAGLRGWAGAPSGRDGLVREVAHEGWSVELRRAPLGVVGFVFEGRPNVFADACGVLRSGNTVVFRIGSDALGTARAIVTHALTPALATAGLPQGAVELIDSPSRAAGWALFADTRLGLAVARGSGEAVAQLGGVARQAGVPVSLHGTGGAWLLTGTGVSTDRLAAVVRHSLDRKVCNTLNVACVLSSHADRVVPLILDALNDAAAARGTAAKLHVAAGSEPHVPAEWFARTVTVERAAGPSQERQAEVLPLEDLGTEWEWERSPEMSLVVVDSLSEAIALCNRLSPRLVASLVSDDQLEQDQFWAAIDAPFAGDGFTRWVDGQFALDAPELGLSNWEHGRLLARAGVLSGDTVFTIRARMRQTDPNLHR